MKSLKFTPAKYAVSVFLFLPVLAIAVVLLGALAPAFALFVAILILALWLPLTWAVYMATKQSRVMGTMEVAPDTEHAR
jgi:ABC-type transport system involved in cytochrome bd biosynthesis fused ATPase/permease subunit